LVLQQRPCVALLRRDSMDNHAGDNSLPLRSLVMASDGFTTRPVYMGTHGVIAAGHYLAARAGQLMFDRGGNAIDAVVASGFALNLLKPHLNGLGGEVPLLIYSAKEEKVFSVSGQGFIGKAATVDWFNKEGIDL